MRTSSLPPYRSKTLATWIAVLAGTFGLHRVYLHGWRDTFAWLHLPPTALGVWGVFRMRELGQDDHLSWPLIPLLGVMLAQSMLCAVMYGLTPDHQWDAQRNPGQSPRRTRWGPVLGAAVALLVGATVLMSTIAFGVQKYFEWTLSSESAPQVSASNPR